MKNNGQLKEWIDQTWEILEGWLDSKKDTPDHPAVPFFTALSVQTVLHCRVPDRKKEWAERVLYAEMFKKLKSLNS